MLTQCRSLYIDLKNKSKLKERKKTPTTKTTEDIYIVFPQFFQSKLKLDHKATMCYFNPVRFLILVQEMGH